MTVTVANFAAELGVTNARLLEQLNAAGIPKNTAEDVVTEDDKHRLLASLRSAHGEGGGEPRRITLNRTSTTEIKQAVGAGKSRTVQVEVRRKRTYVKREAIAEEATESAIPEQLPVDAQVAAALQESAPAVEAVAAGGPASVSGESEPAEEVVDQPQQVPYDAAAASEEVAAVQEAPRSEVKRAAAPSRISERPALDRGRTSAVGTDRARPAAPPASRAPAAAPPPKGKKAGPAGRGD
ncbi:translation initiation factor IF-2 associated domain-containing protein, partial [Acidithiobacillus ferridurans]|uniref:translation initiation factor IF-2 associated domain-containing protein n=1 Tax=Acidithiobacillus ferridurans TaxID=1232575 RepID=UPI001C07A7EB